MQQTAGLQVWVTMALKASQLDGMPTGARLPIQDTAL
jgi:hypothetical protein